MSVFSRVIAAVLFSILLGAASQLEAQELPRDIEEAERTWDDIFARGDKEAYSHLLADEFSWTYVTGEVIDKAEAVSRLNPFTLNDVSKQILEYGDTAIVYGTASLNFQGRPLTERWVRIWLKNDDGYWRAVFFQATEIQ